MDGQLRALALATALALEACNPVQSSRSATAQAPDAEASLKLSQICMEGGRKFFQDVTDPKQLAAFKLPQGTQWQSFIAHYNQSMNKCFVLVSFSALTAQSTSETDEIYDAFEGGEYAGFGKTSSDGQEHIYECEEGSAVHPLTTCHSNDQWNAIVAKYMGREE